MSESGDAEGGSSVDKYYFFSNIGNIPVGKHTLKVSVLDSAREVLYFEYPFEVGTDQAF